MDGSVAKDVDAIILATGYNFAFPFLDESMIEFKHNSPSMYKHMFRVEENPSIAFIGCLQPVGCMFPVAELQARLATKVFKGSIKLPPIKDMEQDIAKDFARKQSECYDAQKHPTRVRFKPGLIKSRKVKFKSKLLLYFKVYYIPYCNSIADIIGCKPRLGQMILSDPLLALRCYFGPCSPPQYRLTGPEAWGGARRAIMEIQEKNVAQMKKKVTQKSNSKFFLIIMLAMFCLYFVLIHIVFQ